MFDGFAALADLSREEREQHFLASLSTRERNVYGAFLAGMRWADIARHVGISPRDIHNTKRRILNKLHLFSEVDLVLFAVRHSILSTDYR